MDGQINKSLLLGTIDKIIRLILETWEIIILEEKQETGVEGD